MRFSAASVTRLWSVKASFGANTVTIVERFRELISGSDTKPITTEALPSVTKDEEPSALEQTIATYKTHFGERWKEAFFATAKVNVCVESLAAFSR